MKHKLSFTVAIWWLILSAVMGFFLLAATDKEARESESENRYLAAFPKLTGKSLTDASFMSGFEDFLSDAFFGRAQVTHFTSRLTGVFNALSQEDKMVVAAQNMEQKLADEGAADAPPAEQPQIEDDIEDEVSTEVVDDAELITDKKSYLWLKRVDGGNKILYEYPVANVATYAENLKLVLSYLPVDGQVYFTQAPLAAMAHRWTDQREVYCGWGSSAETMLESFLTDQPRIHVFNTLDILSPYLSKGEDLFYRTDHHWTAKGAYLVASAMIESQGVPVMPYDEFDYKVIQSEANEDGEKDTFEVLYALLPSHSYIMTKLTTAKEISLMNYQSVTYRAFMNNSRTPWRKITTGFNTGRKALVICDSYGNAFAPYIMPYYDEVHMVDFRYGYYNKSDAGGSISDLMKYHGIDDVFIVVSTANDMRKENSTKYLRSYLVN